MESRLSIINDIVKNFPAQTLDINISKSVSDYMASRLPWSGGGLDWSKASRLRTFDFGPLSDQELALIISKSVISSHKFALIVFSEFETPICIEVSSLVAAFDEILSLGQNIYIIGGNFVEVDELENLKLNDIIEIYHMNMRLIDRSSGYDSIEVAH